MAVRVGINGMGRIGRTFWRVCRARTELDVVAINDVGEPRTVAHLLRFDSVRGRLPAHVQVTDDAIVVDGVPMAALRHPEPAAVPWAEYGVDVVLEATGRFTAAADARGHLAAGARRVLISTATTDPDVTILMGINEHEYESRRHAIVSPGCCTSTAVAPMFAALRQLYRIDSAVLTTVHAYDTTKSVLHDSPHRDLRMGRAAALNLIPARLKAGSVHALGTVFPELAGRIEGLHVRVPASIGCAVELVVHIDQATTAGEVNAALASAAAGDLKGYLWYTEEEIVSSDIIGTAESCIVDGQLTTVVGRMVKIIGWYDNEWGFANRLADVAGLIAHDHAHGVAGAFGA